MNNIASHKLTINVEKLYTIDEINTLPLKNMFFKIERVSITNTSFGKMVSVKGKQVFYGYKLENGSFYDLNNHVYIPAMYIDLNHGVIEEYKDEIIRVLN